MEITINSQSKTISFRRGTTIKDLLSTLKDLSNWEDYILDVDNVITISSQWSGTYYPPGCRTTCDTVYPSTTSVVTKPFSGNITYTDANHPLNKNSSNTTSPNFGDDVTYTTNLIVKK